MSEHFPPDIGSRQARARIRLRFLTVLDELCPQVRGALLSLWSDFKPIYLKAVRAEAGSSLNHTLNEAESEWMELVPRGFLDWYYDGVEAGDPTVPELNQRLDNWSDQFNISCDWISEAAISTIATWARVSEAEKTPGWFWHPAGFWTPLAKNEQEFTFTDLWNPLVESPTEATARIRDNMDRSFDKWFKATKAVANKRGYESPPVSEREADYLQWLIRYRVRGEQMKAILSDADRIESTQGISLAVHRMARRIGLNIPTGKGRPRQQP